ncbi:MAG TPA: fibronectin type III domain-containing protein [Anaeromyxobacteraceae bacterium]|nr:fibronectin type III domain-containing protein [Anaeromyxobacteraceae bacterium]
MRTRVALLLCLSSLPPSAALAQTAGVISIAETSDTQDGGQNDGVINIAECSGVNQDGAILTPTALNLTWLLSGVPAAGTYYKVYATTQACPTSTFTPSTDIVDLTSGFQLTNGQSGSWPPTGNIQAVTEILVPLTVGCAVSTTVTNVNLCVTVYDSGQASVQDGAKATAVLVVDTRLPATPAITSVTPGDSALTVRWSAGTGGPTVSYYTVTATPVPPDASHTNCNPGGAAGSHTVTGAGSTSYRLGGLTNGACYDVTVTATSDALNPGTPSAAVPGSPVPVDDFWRLYQAAGGREQGGCGGSAGMLALLALVPLARRLRRRRP